MIVPEGGENVEIDNYLPELKVLTQREAQTLIYGSAAAEKLSAKIAEEILAERLPIGMIPIVLNHAWYAVTYSGGAFQMGRDESAAQWGM